MFDFIRRFSSPVTESLHWRKSRRSNWPGFPPDELRPRYVYLVANIDFTGMATAPKHAR